MTVKAGDDYLRAPLTPDNTPEDDTQFEANIRWLRDRYHLTIERGLGIFDRFHISGETATDTELKICVSIIVREVQKYPPDFFIRNNIASLALLKNVRRAGKNINGVFDSNTGVIVLDSAAVYVKKTFAHTFHHEVYHACDWHDHGYEQDNLRWPEVQTLDSPPPTAQEERADIAEKMMMASSHVRLLEIIKRLKNTEAGRVLQEKVNLIKQDYFRFSQGYMDTAYWEELLA
ncbi:MAG TPA: hypothetical protein VF209_01565 [Patescibacteria group bacterium]